MNKTLIAALAILSVGSVFSQESRFFVSGVNSHEMKEQAGMTMTYYNAILDKVLIINEYSDLFLDPTGIGKTYKIKEPMCHDIKSIIGSFSKYLNMPTRVPMSVMLDDKLIMVQFDCSLEVVDKRDLVPQDPPKAILDDGGQTD